MEYIKSEEANEDLLFWFFLRVTADLFMDARFATASSLPPSFSVSTRPFFKQKLISWSRDIATHFTTKQIALQRFLCRFATFLVI